MFLPSGNVFGSIATFGFVVENFSSGAAKFTRFYSIKANVELLAVLRVLEMWMSNDLTSLVVLVFLFWALEAVLQFLLGFDASIAVGSFRPNACSSVLIEMEPSCALVLDVVTVDACIEDVAN